MKYNSKLDLDSNNSLSLIISDIKPNSTVLEFGCAYGRMTKYLKEVLNCKVYIVEIDSEAIKYSSQYSEGQILGDIEEYRWLQEYGNIRFDYIIFADVLEHLINPQKVLGNAQKLLDENGAIFISIPNVAHNSILIDLYNNKFQYREIGLLDNTHIKFFTYSSLVEMVRNAELEVAKSMATYSKVGSNEFNNKYEDLPPELRHALKSRKYGEIYQFVLKLEKKGSNCTTESLINAYPRNYFIQLFVDAGDGFSEEQSIKRFFTGNSNRYSFQFDLSKYDSIKRIRIDPVNVPAIVKVEKISIDGIYFKEELLSNALYNMKDLFFFNVDDPSIEITTSGGNIGSVEILLTYYEMEGFEQDLLNHINSYALDLKRNLEDNKVKNEAIENENELLRVQASNLQRSLEINRIEKETLGNENKQLRDQVSNLEKDLNINKLEKETLQNENERLRMKASSLETNLETIKSEKEAFEVENEQFKIEIYSVGNRLTEYKNIIARLEEENNSFKSILHEIYNSTSWKLTNPLRVVKKVLKNDRV